MSITSIEWTDRSVNPIRARLGAAVGHHCEKVSPGCANCYASRLQSRFKMPPFQVDKRGDVQPFFDERRLQEVLRRVTPTKWFWCDMSDLFGAWVPDEWIDRCFAAMALTPEHTHQVLTKRPERMRDYLTGTDRHRAIVEAMDLPDWLPSGRRFPVVPENWPLPNVWLGTSVEDQKTADARIKLLLDTPAAVRFISAEPLLGPVRLNVGLGIYGHVGTPCCTSGVEGWHRFTGENVRRLDWVIVGGESGTGARPCDVAWVRSIVAQCKAASVPVFVKQLGRCPSVEGKPEGVRWARLVEMDGRTPSEWWAPYTGGRGKHGDPSEWPEDLRVREFPAAIA